MSVPFDNRFDNEFAASGRKRSIAAQLMLMQKSP
jgi:hypothetical protein